MKGIYDKIELDKRITLAEVYSGTWNGNLDKDRRIVLKVMSLKHITSSWSAYSWLTIGICDRIFELNNIPLCYINGCNGLQDSC